MFTKHVFLIAQSNIVKFVQKHDAIGENRRFKAFNSLGKGIELQKLPYHFRFMMDNSTLRNSTTKFEPTQFV